MLFSRSLSLFLGALLRCDVVWCGLVWCGMVWCGVLAFLVLSCLVLSCARCYALVCFGLQCTVQHTLAMKCYRSFVAVFKCSYAHFSLSSLDFFIVRQMCLLPFFSTHFTCRWLCNFFECSIAIAVDEFDRTATGREKK